MTFASRLAPAVAVSLLLSTGTVARAASIALDPLPRLPIQEKEATRSLSRQEVLAMLRESTPVSAEFKLEDDRYFLVTREWVEKMFLWVKAFLARQLDPERLDGFLVSRPREVALMIESLAELDVQRAHAVRGQALVGMLSLECHLTATQEPLDGHICFYVIFGTAAGLHVLEPATGKIQALRDFPQRNDVIRVFF